MIITTNLSVLGPLSLSSVSSTTTSLSAMILESGVVKSRILGSMSLKGDNEYLPQIGLSFPNIFNLNTSILNFTNQSLTVSLTNQTANTFLAAPNGLSGTPSFRSIVASDIPILNQNTTGNAATATSLLTTRTINGVGFNGTSNILVTNLHSATDNRSVDTIPNDYNSKFDIKGLKTNSVIGVTNGGTYSAVLGIRGWTDSSGGNAHEFAFDSIGGIRHRYGATTTWSSWSTLLNSSNYTTYSPSLNGTGASGTWGISITGNAATATSLLTTRTINGVGFNGTSDIIVPTIYDTNYQRIMHPGGGTYLSNTTSETGAITIKLPTSVYGQSKMISFTVNIFDYVTGESFQVRVNGYQYNAGNWINCTAYILGNPNTNRQFTIRFAKDTTNLRYIVYIGDLNSVWSYPQITITDLQIGYIGGGSLGWTSGWEISMEPTEFATIGATINNPQIGYQSTTNTANSVVLRDASGNFSAGTITGALSGNAATATSLATARTLTIGNTGKTFNGTANVSWSLTEIGAMSTSHAANAITSTNITNWNTAYGWGNHGDGRYVNATSTTSLGIDYTGNAIGYINDASLTSLFGVNDGALFTHSYSTVWKQQIYADYRTGQIALRGKNNGTWQSWRKVWDSVNFDPSSKANSNGSNASGTWGISITGNAATATSLATARTLTIGNTGKTFDGSANVAWTLTEIGATTVGSNLFGLVNPSAISFIRINADNSISVLDAIDFRTAIGAGTGNGNGTVTSVSGTGSVSGLTLSGTVTTSGDLTLGGTLTLTASQVNAVGTITNSTTGNAATATSLQTARTLTIGNTGKTFNGTANVSWSLAEIGAQSILTNPVTGTGTINQIPKFTASGTIGDSQIFDNGTNIGIGTTTPGARLDIRAQGSLVTDVVFRVRNSTDTQNFLVVNGTGILNIGVTPTTNNAATSVLTRNTSTGNIENLPTSAITSGFVTTNTTQTITGKKTFDDVNRIKKITTHSYPTTSGGNFFIGGTGGYDTFEFYSLDGTDQDGLGTSQIYSNPEEGNQINHTSLDNQESSILRINYGETYLKHIFGGQQTSIYVNGQTDKITIEATQNKFANLGTSLITGSKTFEFPNESGTLALKSDVDNKISKHTGTTYTTNAIQTVTQAEYDAIPVKDATTIYFIV